MVLCYYSQRRYPQKALYHLVSDDPSDLIFSLCSLSLDTSFSLGSSNIKCAQVGFMGKGVHMPLKMYKQYFVYVQLPGNRTGTFIRFSM
jgi:hypothetical protein